MDWLKPIDLYCERLGPEFWAEPINAVTNIFIFLSGVFGFYIISKIEKRRDKNTTFGEFFSRNWLYTLSFAACLTGVGSFLFHTHANFISLWGDILPILFFMEVFLAFVLRNIFGWRILTTATALVMFSVAGLILQLSPLKSVLNGSLTYIHAVFILIVIVVALVKKQPRLAQNFGICLALFIFSLFFRTIDNTVCENFSLGTHFIWHILNGLLMLQIIRIAVGLYGVRKSLV